MPSATRPCLGADDVDAVHREGTGDLGEQAGLIGSGDDPQVEVANRLDVSVELPARSRRFDQIAEAVVEGDGRRRLRTSSEHGRHGGGELVDECRLPRGPRRRARRQAVGLGECSEQLEPHRVTDEGGDVLCSSGISQIAPRRGFGEEQVMFHHRTDHCDVVGREAHARCHAVDEHDADLGVVDRVAFADVVEQCAHQQQVGP